MSMAAVITAILATLATSLISGVLSMAGGMILMGVLGFLFTVPSAMVLHGIAQTFSNGSRVWLYRHSVRWRVLFPYSLGAIAVLLVFLFFQFVPSMGLVFLTIGLFPFLALILPSHIPLDIDNPPTAFLSGIVVTVAQMLAGASGPALDVFYLKSQLNRHEILGTKAVTQTLGHLIKLCYYALFLESLGGEPPWWIFPAIIVASVAGNRLGKEVVERIDDQLFRQAGRYVILLIGAVYLGKGLLIFWNS